MGLDELIREGECYLRDGHYTEFGDYYINNTIGYAEWTAKSLMLLQSLYPTHPQTNRFDFWVKRNRADKDECGHLIGILKAFYQINPKINDIDYDGDEVSFEKYSGEIVGNGHKLYNLTIDYDPNNLKGYIDDLDGSKNHLYVSLFFELKGANIKDLSFENVSFVINVRLSKITNINPKCQTSRCFQGSELYV